MFDERAFLARVEDANADTFADWLAAPTPDEENALRACWGDARYQQMRGLALRRGLRRGVEKPRGNVVVLHGVMGGALSAFDRGARGVPLWVQILRLMGGGIERLRLDEDGLHEHDPAWDVRPTGIIKRAYGTLLLTLAQHWNVRAFWFDWRKDLDQAAAALQAQISGWFAPDAPVHLVAHSMGGLVARTFVKNYPERWQAMGGRLIMLGTPNHGAFALVQTLMGLEPMVEKLSLLDLHHSRDDLRRIFNSFPGLYQMLPSPLAVPNMEFLYDAASYGDAPVSQRHLDSARRHHEHLRDAVDGERMSYVAGTGQPTLSGLTPGTPLAKPESYQFTTLGDGRVPHALGLLTGVPTFFAEETHGGLAAGRVVLDALDDLLTEGKTTRLPAEPPARRGADDKISPPCDDDLARIPTLVRRLQTRSAADAPLRPVAPEERLLAEALTRGLLEADRDPSASPPPPPEPPVPLRLSLIRGSIETAHAQIKGGDPVDALAVGHYLGVRPQGAEWALDKAVSDALAGGNGDAGLILTQYTERGIIRGELAQPFFLTDPRGKTNGEPGESERVVVVMGMGPAGRFGVPELTVLARELCWSLGRMGKRHLTTILIGAGNGNLSAGEAVGAWLRGLAQAVCNQSADRNRLTHLTFIEHDPARIEAIDAAIAVERKRPDIARRLDLKTYRPWSREKLAALDKDIEAQAREARAKKGADDTDTRTPTRITVSLEQQTYRFGAITPTAAVPEREIALDPALVMQANDELAGEDNPQRQFERGQFLEKLLMPDDLRTELYTPSPLVMLLDATTARIHWEMLVPPDPIAPAAEGREGMERMARDDRNQAFLGTSRGFTRQLRTTFAPPPEPPPPPGRRLRVLVIADPARDAPLPGAEAEGVEVADLFESYNALIGGPNHIEVVRLFGPREATRTNVLSQVMQHPFDVLHFAGHCTYEPDNPPASGWIFTGGQRLSARELGRVDRIPRFVFSNACESGLTPERAGDRAAPLAPSFAESFFARGVANFICTAWPVDDTGARQFALCVYAALLGLRFPDARSDQAARREDGPQPIHVAMCEARRVVSNSIYGQRTWGAYQHYGNPYLRFFDTGQDSAAEQAPEEKSNKKPEEKAQTDGGRQSEKEDAAP